MKKINLVFCSEDTQTWFEAHINGNKIGLSIPVSSVDEFDSLKDRLTRVLDDVYQRGVSDGAKEARFQIRTAIGF